MNDLKKKNRRILYIAIVLAIVNILIFNLFNRNGGYNIRGEYIEYSVFQALKSSLVTILIGVPIVSLIISLIFSAIPYKGLKYSKRYGRTTLMIIMIVLSLLIIYQIFGLTKHNVTINNEDSVAPRFDKLQKFKNEMLTYKDSSIYYFDKAIEEFSSSNDTFGVSIKYGPILKNYENKISTTSLKFHKELSNNGLTQIDYEKCMKELEKEFTIIQTKYQEYINTGLMIELE